MNRVDVKAAEAFIKEMLMANFSQEVKPDALRLAAEKLCRAIPAKNRREKE